jgi:cyclase
MVKFIIMKNLLISALSFTFIFYLYIPVYPQVNESVSVFKQVKEGIYSGANVTISYGNDGLLIIDTGSLRAAAYTDSVVRATFKGPVKYIINTHMHFDHVGGNNLLSADGAVIISHENTRRRMLEEWIPPEIPGVKYPKLSPYNDEYLPKVCFSDSIKIYFNDEIIKIIHIPEGHSDGDAIVIFQNANAIQTGDLYLSNGFPPLEGTIEGYLAAVDEIIKMCDENTIVIPGHGPLSDREGLIGYRNMLSIGADRIHKLKSQGMTLEEVISAAPLKGLLDRKSMVPESVFIYCVYHGKGSLANKHLQ